MLAPKKPRAVRGASHLALEMARVSLSFWVALSAAPPHRSLSKLLDSHWYETTFCLSSPRKLCCPFHWFNFRAASLDLMWKTLGASFHACLQAKNWSLSVEWTSWWLLLFVSPWYPLINAAETLTQCCSSSGDGVSASSSDNRDFPHSWFPWILFSSVLCRQWPLKAMPFRWTRD